MHRPALVTSQVFSAKWPELFVTALLLVLLAALTVLDLRQRHELRKLSNRVTSHSAFPARPENLTHDIATTIAQQTKEAQELEALNARLSRIPSPLLADPRPLTKAERDRINGSLISTHPDLAAVRHRRDRRVIQRNFSDLFAEANLPPAELERLKELLVETGPYGTNPATARRSIETVEQEIRGMLDDESFQTYRDIQATATRVFLSPPLLALRLSDEGIAPLTPRQARQMALIEKEILAEPKAFRDGEASTEARIYERAATVLTPEQLNSLREMDAETEADH